MSNYTQLRQELDLLEAFGFRLRHALPRWNIFRPEVTPVIDLSEPELPSTAEALAVLSSALGHRYTYVNVYEQAAREATEKPSARSTL